MIEALIIEEKKTHDNSKESTYHLLTVRYKNLLTNKLTTKIVKSCDNRSKGKHQINFNCYQRAAHEYDENGKLVCQINDFGRRICNKFSKGNRVPFMYVPREDHEAMLFTFDINKVLEVGARGEHNLK